MSEVAGKFTLQPTRGENKAKPEFFSMAGVITVETAHDLLLQYFSPEQTAEIHAEILRIIEGLRNGMAINMQTGEMLENPDALVAKLKPEVQDELKARGALSASKGDFEEEEKAPTERRKVIWFFDKSFPNKIGYSVNSSHGVFIRYTPEAMQELRMFYDGLDAYRDVPAWRYPGLNATNVLNALEKAADSFSRYDPADTEHPSIEISGYTIAKIALLSVAANMGQFKPY